MEGFITVIPIAVVEVVAEGPPRNIKADVVAIAGSCGAALGIDVKVTTCCPTFRMAGRGCTKAAATVVMAFNPKQLIEITIEKPAVSYNKRAPRRWLIDGIDFKIFS